MYICLPLQIDDCEIDRRRLVHSLLLRNCDVVPFAHFGEKASIFLARRHFDVLFVSANCLVCIFTNRQINELLSKLLL